MTYDDESTIRKGFSNTNVIVPCIALMFLGKIMLLVILERCALLVLPARSGGGWMAMTGPWGTTKATIQKSTQSVECSACMPMSCSICRITGAVDAHHET